MEGDQGLNQGRQKLTVQSEAVRLTSWPEGGNCPSAEASSLCNTGRLPQNGATEKRHMARDMIGSLDGAKQYRTLAFRVDSFCLGRISAQTENPALLGRDNAYPDPSLP